MNDDGITLKPCPFCGSEAKIMQGLREVWVGCGNRQCRGYYIFGKCFFEDMDEAAEAWNRRANDGE